MISLSGIGHMQVGHMVIRPEPAGLSAARRRIHSVATSLNLSDEEAGEITLAVGEAISNAYRHGTPDRRCGLICVDWSFADETLTVSIQDEGPGFAQSRWRSLPSSKIQCSGFGMGIMAQIVDEMHLETDGGGRVVLKKYIHSAAEARAKSVGTSSVQSLHARRSG